MLSRIHNPESYAKRLQAVNVYWKNHPEKRKEFGVRMVQSRKRKRAERIRESLGVDPEWTPMESGIASKVGSGRRDYETLLARRQLIFKSIKEKSFGRLSRSQKRVLMALYFAEEHFPTLEFVADEFGCTRQNISMHERNALRRLGIIS